MSILSKICVVVLTVASLVAMVVIIQLATVEPNYKQLYRQEADRVKLAEQKANAVEAARMSTAADLRAVISLKSKEVQTLRADYQKLLGENRSLKMRQTAMGNQLNTVNSQLTDLKSGVKLHANNAALLQDNLKKAWERGNKLEKEVIDLVSHVKEEQAKSYRLNRTVSVLREQVEESRQNLAAKNELIAELKKNGVTASASGQGDSETGTMAVGGEKIMGAIDAVQNNLASVNIGSANGVKANMKLIIYRGSKFVGYLKVEEVRLSSAAGIILDKQMTPKAGDKVISNLN